MAIRHLKKVSLLGSHDVKRQAIADVQSLGVMHVIPLSESEKNLHERPDDYYEAIKYIMDCQDIRTPVTRRDADFDPCEIVAKALDNRKQRRDVENQKDKLVRYFRDIQPWGYFDFPSKEDLNGRQLFFYKVPGFKRRQLAKLKGVTFQEVHAGNRNAYIVVISDKEPAKNLIPGQRVNIGPKSLSTTEREIEELTIKLEDLNDERARFTRWLPLLLQNLNRIEDQTIFEYVADRTLDADQYFTFQGWVPTDDLDKVKAIADKHGLAFYAEEPTKGDKPPTLFKNPEKVSSGEDLVAFYQMPAYSAWDPSAILYFSFAVFFAMIMSDAGYAVVIAGIILMMWKKLGKDDASRRIRRLGLMLATVSFIYGVLVGSYFGFMPDVAFLKDSQILDVTDFDMMMKISILTGVLHLFLANGIAAWQNRRNSLTSLSYIGWMVIFAGSTGLWLIGSDHQPSMITAICGAGAVLFFTSDRPFNSITNIVLRFVDGLLGLANVSKAFGDTLSYMRLFALGLASASLAVMFNQLASQVAENMAGIGVFLAMLILILGHSLNFALGIMGGVVHGLRLNLIEFFSWSLNDEGYAFNPFKLKEKKQWKQS